MNPTTLANKYRKIIKERNPNIQMIANKDGHFYPSPATGEQYRSVTYFTSIIKDPSIALFKMNRALEYVAMNFPQFTMDNISEHIKAAKLVPEVEFTGAGDIGTQTHAWREKFFKQWIDSGEGNISDKAIDDYQLPAGAPPEVISGCRAIKSFLKETQYIPVFCEVPLVDDDLKVGGTADDGGVFPNRTKIPITDPVMGDGYTMKYHPYFGFVDLKTSNQGKKVAYAYQVRGLYYGMFVKTFKIQPQETFILHTSKLDGRYKLIKLTDMDFLVKDAKMLIHVSRSWDKVMEMFDPKPIII